MKRINLLPGHIAEAAARERSRRKYRVAMSALLFSSIAILACGVSHVWALDRQVQRAEREMVPLREQAGVLNKLEDDHRQLAERATWIRSLRDPVPPAATLALLTQVIPEDAVVRKLVIDAQPVSWAGSGQRKRATPRRDQAAPLMTIQVEGVAYNSSTIPEIVRRFLATEKFTNVRLENNQPTHERDVAGQRFRLTADMSPPSASVQGGRKP